MVVTGAASGIGRAAAMMLARLGLRVSAWDIDSATISTLVEDLGAEDRDLLASRVVDVTNSRAVRDAFAATELSAGPVGFLVNNAGPSSFSSVGFEDGMDESLGSVKKVTEAWLSTRGSVDGHLVNVSSVSGALTGAGAAPWYSAAKAAIAGYTRHLAVNRPNGIRANAVAPGVIDTLRTRDFRESDEGRDLKLRNPMARFGSAEDVAYCIIWLVSPAANYVNGVLLPVDGGAVVVL